MSEQQSQQEMTAADATRDLRIMGASIVVDNGNYGRRLLDIADWIEHNFAKMLTSKSITLSKRKSAGQQREIIFSLYDCA